MATAEEIIKLMSQNPEMYETKVVEEEYCTLDELNREIILPSVYQIIGVESDEKVERINFKFPRIVGDNIDLSKLSIRINYQNGNQEIDKYFSDVKSFDSEYVYFDWVLSRKVTKYQGEVYFIVCAVKTNTDGTITNEWNTTLAKSNVLEGLEVENFTPDEEDTVRDLLNQSLSIINNERNESINEITSTKNASKEEIKEYGDAIKESIPQDYTSLDSLVRELERTHSAGIVETAQGEVVEISDSEGKLFRNIELFGKGVQEKINGYQLFDSSKIPTLSQNGATVTNNNDGSFTISGKGNLSNDYWNVHDLTPAETHGILSVGSINLSGISATRPNFIVQIRNASQVYVELNPSNLQGTVTQQMVDDAELFMRVGFFGSSGMPIVSGSVKPMLYQSGDGEWEPYTGKIESPSPNLESPIVGVGNYNESTQKYDVEINVTGNQLFDASKIPTKSQGAVTITNNNDGSFTVSGSGNIDSSFSSSYTLTEDETKKLFKSGFLNVYCEQSTNPAFMISFRTKGGIKATISTLDNNERKVDITEFIKIDGIYAVIQFNGASGSQVVPGTVKPMVYQNGDGKWEPYKSQQSILTFDEPLYGIAVNSGGNYVDESGQKCVSDVLDMLAKILTRYFGIKIFDGSEDEGWNIQLSSQTNVYRMYTDAISKIILRPSTNNTEASVLCNFFKISSANASYLLKNEGISIQSESGRLFIYSKKFSAENSLPEWKSWLQSNPMTVLYRLSTPNVIPLTEDQLTALQSLMAYNPNTNVSTNTNPQAGMRLTYTADGKIYIDNKFNALAQQIIDSIGGQ